MDSFGSNATSMGGAAGRADSMIDAVEAQKAEGVLHMHAFIYFQMICQFASMKEISELLRKKMLSVEAMKEYISHVRCASYPDVEKFKEERDDIEKAWPAYATDYDLCRLPTFFWQQPDSNAANWKREYEDRLQHTLSRMNHHIHPVKNPATGERRPLGSCKPKGKGDVCKADFPLESQVTEEPLFVCHCVAADRNLTTRGPRSLLGTALPKRSEP